MWVGLHCFGNVRESTTAPASYKQTEKIVGTHPSDILTHLSFSFGVQ